MLGVISNPSHTHRIFSRISNNFDCSSALQVDTASMPRPSQPMRTNFDALPAAQAPRSRTGCENVCENVCKTLFTLWSRVVPALFFLALDHLEKSDRGWNRRVRLTRESSTSSFSSLFDASMYTVYYVLKPVQNQSLLGQGPGSSPFLVGQEHNESYSERSPEGVISIVRRHEIDRRVV